MLTCATVKNCTSFFKTCIFLSSFAIIPFAKYNNSHTEVRAKIWECNEYELISFTFLPYFYLSIHQSVHFLPIIWAAGNKLKRAAHISLSPIAASSSFVRVTNVFTSQLLRVRLPKPLPSTATSYTMRQTPMTSSAMVGLQKGRYMWLLQTWLQGWALAFLFSPY